MAETTRQLLRLLEELRESIKSCTSGTRNPVIPGLTVEGVGEVGLPIAPTVAKQLIEQASPAPYGRGEETILDPQVRNVWQIEPRRFSLRNPQWESF